MHKELVNKQIDVKIKLSALWIVLMLLYIYCDIFSLFRPGHLNEIIAGFMGPFEISQVSLFASGAMMIIPALMVGVCLFFKAGIVKWLNIVTGALYTLIGIGNLIGEVWAYYIMYGVIELALTIGIIVVAFQWPIKTENRKELNT